MNRKEAMKQILVCIIIAYWPSFEQLENPLIKPHGYYNPIQDKWFWNRVTLSELKFYQLYKIIELVAPEQVYIVSLKIQDS